MRPLIRLWDADFSLLFDSDTDDRTVEEFMASQADAAEIHFTRDFDGDSWRTRQGGRLIKTADGRIEYQDAREFLEHMATPANPFYDASRWTTISSRYEMPKFLTEWLDEEMEKLLASLPEDSPARLLYESLPKPPKSGVEPTSTPYTLDSVFTQRPGWWWAL